jgi:hypothetical protein
VREAVVFVCGKSAKKNQQARVFCHRNGAFSAAHVFPVEVVGVPRAMPFN